MASANYIDSNSSNSNSDVSSSDENDDSTNFEGVNKLDLSHQELDSEMFRYHLEDICKIPDRLKTFYYSSKNGVTL